MVVVMVSAVMMDLAAAAGVVGHAAATCHGRCGCGGRCGGRVAVAMCEHFAEERVLLVCFHRVGQHLVLLLLLLLIRCCCCRCRVNVGAADDGQCGACE